MRRVSISSGSLFVEDRAAWAGRGGGGVAEWRDVFQPKSVHELVFDPIASGVPASLAVLLGQQANADKPVVWIEPVGGVAPSCCAYPPAWGADVGRLHLLRPKTADLAWAVTECLRCRHVGAVIATMPVRMSRVEVRRLQLAAERGSSLGILLRPDRASAGLGIHAASSRWRVAPTPGTRTTQRWRVEHVHGHGRQFGPSFIVEKHRATGETHFVYPSAQLGDYPALAAAS